MKRTKDNIFIHKNTGITLISLIITIIVIILIAAINISIIFGEDGVITEAIQASEKKKESEMLDDIGFAWSELEIKYLSQNSGLSKEEYIKNNLENALNSKGIVTSDSIKTTANGGTVFKFRSNSNNKTYNVLRSSSGQFSTVGEYDKLSNIIKPENYGDYVKYSAGGVDGWRIFYNDTSNIFIITSEHLHKDNLPTEALSGSNPPCKIINTQPYNIKFNTPGTPTSNDISILNSDTAKKYLYAFTTDYNTPNLQIISFLLNTNIWNKFVIPNIADSATGTPTLEMFQASWNSKYTNTPVRFYIPTGANYKYGYAFNTATSSWPLDGTNDAEEKLYLPHYGSVIPDFVPDVPTDSLGYWLASPYCGAYNGIYTQLVYIHSKDIGIWGGDPTINEQHSIRPVVCLNKDVYGLKTDSGWELIK